MNDPEIHSNNWEWDMVGPSAQWRYSHNDRHHIFSNVLGMDEDIGFGVMRVSRDQEWKPGYLWAPLRAVVLAVVFEWGIALHDLSAEQERDHADRGGEGRGQAGDAPQDGAARPPRITCSSRRSADGAGAGRSWRTSSPTGFRNVWAYVVIVCGHFVDGAEKFTPAAVENETKPEWYLRQMLGTANFNAGPVLRIHERKPLLPDRAPPVSRSAEQQATPRLRCEFRRSWPNTTCPTRPGPLLRQFWHTVRTICKLSLPDRFLTSDLG